jgi:hypothetical protein
MFNVHRFAMSASNAALGAASAAAHLVTTFDPAKKGTNTTLTNTNHTATIATASSGVLVVDGMTTENYYVDFTVVTSTNLGFIGVGNTSIDYNAGLGNDANGWSYNSAGNKRHSNVDTAYGATWVAGDVIRATYNNGSLSFAKNSVDQGTAFTGLSGTLYFGYSDNLVGAVTIS